MNTALGARFSPTRRAMAAVAALVVTGGLAACQAKHSSGSGGGGGGDTINVGLLAPLTGDFAQIGQDSVNGAQLAVDEINAKGGVLGKKLKLVTDDDGGLPSTGINAAAKMTTGNVQAVLGPDLSNVVEAVSPTMKQAALPWLVSAISPKDFQLGNEWMFGGRPTDTVNAQTMAQYAAQKLHVKKIAVVYGLDNYAEPTLPAIKQYAAASGLTITSTQGLADNATTASAQVQAAIASHADAIEFWGLIPGAALIEKTAKSLGFTGPVFGANALVNQTTIGLAGPAAERRLAATTFALTNPAPQIQKFITDYKAKHSSAPNDHAPLYYDMVNLLAQAIQKAGSTDPGKIRDALKTLKFNGVDGPVAFGPNGADIAPSGVIVQVTNGQQKVVDFLTSDPGSAGIKSGQ